MKQTTPSHSRTLQTNLLLRTLKYAKMFADEFTKNFSTSIPINVSVSTNSLSRFQMSIDIREVKAVLKDMPNSVSGPDGVPAVVYKRMANF